MISALEARNLTKIFGPFKANDSVSVNFLQGRIHAVIGENGAGKSTLMKMLFGLYQPDDGEIILNGQSVRWRTAMDAISNGIGMVQQHFSLVEPLTAIDNIILGSEPANKIGALDRKRAIETLKANLPSTKLEIPWEIKVEDLSVGEKQRVEILKLIYRKAKILILDEPTAVLTPQETNDLFSVLREMKASGHTIIIISHKLNEIFALCDDYTVLRAGKVTATGKIADTNKDKIVEAMIGQRLPPASGQRTARSGEIAVKCTGLIENQKVRGALKGINLEVYQGEIVGVAGVEGAGQRSLVHALMGLKKIGGSVEVLGLPVESTRQVRDLGVGIVPEDRIHEGLWPQESAYHNMIIGLEDKFVKAGFFQEADIEKQTANWAAEFDVRGSSLQNNTSDFSGGNQQKIIFAREVAGRKPKLLICHQPTRGVDLGAIHRIHEKIFKLRNEGLAILILSSDLDEVMKLSDRIYVFFEGKITGHFTRENFDANRIGHAMAGTT